MFQMLANIFGYLLEFLYNTINNYGLAIILFTVIIKLLLLPLSIKQQRTMKKSSELQEKMKTIQFKYKNDPEFLSELRQSYRDYANRPSLLYYAEKMTKDLGGAKVYLKREDLNLWGADKINNVLGQILLAKRMGK